MKKLFICCTIAATLFLFVSSPQAALTIYTDETAYLNAIDSLLPAGYNLVQEGFEDDTVWGTARSPNATDSVTSQGITWTSNHPDAVTGSSRITTGSGPAYTGFWGAYSSPHGDPDRNTNTTFCDVTPPDASCFSHDGLIGDSGASVTLYATGVWFDGTFNSTVVIILDGHQANPISFGAGGTLTNIGHQFIGLIETTGFDSFELRETEGKTGDDKFVFFDGFTLSGVFPPQASIHVSPASVAFGSVTVGTSADQTITVANTGSANLTIGNIALANPLPLPFEVVSAHDGCSTQTLTSGTSCTVVIRYAPTLTGMLNDSFDIPSDDPDAPTRTVNVSGTGLPAPTPNIAVSATSINFGSVTVGTSMNSLLTISNTGDANLTIYDIALANSLLAPFDLVPSSDNCSNQTLTPATSCTISVRYAPNAIGILNDSFDIPSDDPNATTITVNVSGNGTPIPTPNITVSTTAIDFGSVTVGSSADSIITVNNNGDANLTIGGIAAINSLTAPFSLLTGQDHCSNQTLTPAASCSATVHYAPTVIGILNDSFDIPSDDPDTASITINVSGEGTPVPTPNITVSTAAIDFGSLMLGTQVETTVTVTNDGNATLTIGDVALANPLIAPFELVTALDNCSNQNLTPTASCTITVGYSPTASGILNDSFDIPSNDPDTATVTINVSGTGTPAPTPNIAVSATAIDFASVTEGSFADLIITVSSTGNANLIIAGIAGANSLAAPFGIVAGLDSCSNQTLLPATDCSVTIRFSPTTTGPFNDSFDIPSNDPDAATLTINVSGVGLSASTNNPPAAPNLIFPAARQIDLPTAFAFRWGESLDPDGEAVNYDLYYCEDSNFAGCLPANVATLSEPPVDNYYAGVGGLWITGLVLLAGISGKRKKSLLLLVAIISTLLTIAACGGGGSGGGTAEISYNISGLTPNTTYYWKVLAGDGQDSSESSVRSFTTQ